MLTADPATGWYAENTQITLTDPTTTELVITPKKVAGLTQISTKPQQDTNPAVAEQIGPSLGRSVAKKIDAAFFANTDDQRAERSAVAWRRQRGRYRHRDAYLTGPVP